MNNAMNPSTLRRIAPLYAKLNANMSEALLVAAADIWEDLSKEETQTLVEAYEAVKAAFPVLARRFDHLTEAIDDEIEESEDLATEIERTLSQAFSEAGQAAGDHSAAMEDEERFGKEPSAEEPSIDELFADEPFADEPFANKPFANKPFANKPFADEPSSDELPF